jgi:adenosylmethionine-8-amino-7-oxononanoate aminotransferase
MNKTFSERDRSLLWHPFTQEKTAPLPITITSAKGAYLFDETGKSYLDLVSSWWVNLHGHAHPEIAKAIYAQAQALEHVMFAGFTHPPAIRLCESLQTVLPNTLSRFFFSDNGSTAVEAALKMSFQYGLNQGQHKPYFLSFSGAYHGDTFGAMSVGIESGFHAHFKSLLFQVLTVPYPDTWQDDTLIQEKENDALNILDLHLTSYANQISAIILEPLVQGASGMRMCRPSFLTSVIQRVKQHGIHVIFDEVMTGFGRTGTTFAMDQIIAQDNTLTPDFLCLSKGLSGGFLPLALTITTQNIYEGFLSDTTKGERDKTFTHGHSYTANPLGCAAALASFLLLNTQACTDQIQMINKTHQSFLSQLPFNDIEKPRCIGTIAAFDLHSRIHSSQIKEIAQQCLNDGLLIRPLGRTIYLLPPYCISQEELGSAYKQLLSNIELVCHQAPPSHPNETLYV